jgi:GNAT superfamily N-acetyltransferase
MSVRFASEADLDRVNELRGQVNALHAAGRPDIFKPGFGPELRVYVHAIYGDPDKRIAVCERDGSVCGFAVLNHVSRPETPYMYARDFLDIDEFCVDARHRRQGVGTELIDFIRGWAKGEGFDRVELNVWEFNADALAFYEALGFETYRRYMELRF